MTQPYCIPQPLPLVVVGMVVVLAMSGPVGASTAIGGRGGLAYIQLGSTHIGDVDGGVGWNSAGVSYDAGTYLQSQQLTSASFTTNTGLPIHYSGSAPAMGAVLGPAGGSVSLTVTPHLGILKSQTTVRTPMNCHAITGIPECTGCTPNRNAYAARLVDAAMTGARDTGHYFLDKIPGAAEAGLLANYATLVAGLRQSDAFQPITADFNYFNGRCSANREILTNTATFDIRSTNPHPAAFTAEWKHELNAQGTSHRFVSCAVRLQRGQLPISGEALNQQPIAAQDARYGFGLAGVERPLWTPAYT